MKVFIIVLGLFLILSFIIPLVNAESFFDQPPEVIIKALNAFFRIDTSYMESDIRLYIVALIIFVLIMFIISDIFNRFGFFKNQMTDYVIGFAIASIVALTGGIFWLTLRLMQLLSVFGVIAVVVILITAFLAALAIHSGIDRFAQWALQRRSHMAQHQ